MREQASQPTLWMAGNSKGDTRPKVHRNDLDQPTHLKIRGS